MAGRDTETEIRKVNFNHFIEWIVNSRKFE